MVAGISKRIYTPAQPRSYKTGVHVQVGNVYVKLWTRNENSRACSFNCHAPKREVDAGACRGMNE